MQPSKVKVLYVDGQGRSGSTLIHNVLGQFEGFFAGGELREIWKRILLQDRPCGCGVLISECEVWRGVLNEAFGGLDQVDANNMVRLRNKARNRHSLLLLLPWRERLLESRLHYYLASLERFYQGIHVSTGSNVIIDSSKSLLYCYTLGMLPSIDLYVVHVVRDPRGVAYSLRKRKMNRIPGFSNYNPVVSSLVWNMVNLTRELFWRHSRRPYLRLRYEDFVSRPQEAVERILDFVEEEVIHLPFTGKHEVDMDVTHTVGGNANTRFRTGAVSLQLDEEWKAKLPLTDKAIIKTFTWPLILRYGYRQQ
jgi:hypothetical protein